jgi:hypothetical protein
VTIRAARGRNQIVLFSSLLEGLRPCAIVVQKKKRTETKKTEKKKMCQKNVTDGRRTDGRTDDGRTDGRTTDGRTTDATIIPAWTQLIVTLCYNNLVSNKMLKSTRKQRGVEKKPIYQIGIFIFGYPSNFLKMDYPVHTAGSK